MIKWLCKFSWILLILCVIMAGKISGIGWVRKVFCYLLDWIRIFLIINIKIHTSICNMNVLYSYVYSLYYYQNHISIICFLIVSMLFFNYTILYLKQASQFIFISISANFLKLFYILLLTHSEILNKSVIHILINLWQYLDVEIMYF